MSLKFPAKDFLDVYSIISDLSAQLEKDRTSIGPTRIIPEDQKRSFLPILKTARDISADLSLDVSVRLIENILTKMSGEYKVRSFGNELQNLKSRIRDEVDISPVILRIRREKVDYFSSSTPFRENVAEKFPGCSYDIEEASRCFALARYTACVMHLQKVIEAGLEAFLCWFKASGLITEFKTKRNPNWGNIVGPLSLELRRRRDEDDWPEGFERERQFAERAMPFIQAVQTAWRNPAMHLGSRYDEEQAEDIYYAIRGFMWFVSEHINERGESENLKSMHSPLTENLG